MWVFWLVKSPPSHNDGDPGVFNPVSPPSTIGFPAIYIQPEEEGRQSTESLSQIWHTWWHNGYTAAMCAKVGKQHTGRTDNVFKHHVKQYARRLVQDGGVEGRAVTPPCESTGITTNCWTVIDGKTPELTKKDTSHPKTKEKPQWDSRRGAITIKSNPITAGWVTHKLENKYTTEVHPLEWRFWAPRQASQFGGVQQWEEEFLDNQTLKPSGIWLQNFDRTGGNRDSTVGGHTQSSVCIGTQGKEQWPHRRLNRTYLLVLEGSLQRQGMAVAHREDKDTSNRSPGKYSLAKALPESAISPTKRPGRLQRWVASGQTTNREGTQPHPSADKRIKVLLSSAHHSKTQLYPPPVPPIRKLAQAS